MKKSIFILSVFVSVSLSQQKITEEDYRAGPIVYGTQIQPLLKIISRPIKVSAEDEPQTGGLARVNGRDTLLPPDKYYIYEFDSLTIYTNGWGYIQSFTLTKSGYKTKRGVQIGDAEEKVRRLYGNGDWGTTEYFEEGHARSISFHIVNGRVASISMGDYHP